MPVVRVGAAGERPTRLGGTPRVPGLNADRVDPTSERVPLRCATPGPRPEMYVKKPVVGPALSIEPVQRVWLNFVGSLAARAVHQVHGLGETVIPPTGGMAKRKAGDRCLAPSGGEELGCP